MILATYYLSSPVTPRQFMDSDLYGGDKPYNNICCWSDPRGGDFRVSMSDFWGVIYFHTGGQVDIELDFLPEKEVIRVLQELADTFFVRMELHQPKGVAWLPLSVKPGGGCADGVS